MDSQEIRKRFLEFFQKRGHKIVPSSSLLPDDPSVLLTTAGMQQFKKYYIGEADAMKDFGTLNTASVQKSFRTSDIDEVGDESHLTFFEMLGNFSFGGYFKKEAIQYAYDFIVKELRLEISFVAVFKGSDSVPRDDESRQVWKSLGVEDVREEGMNDVFWGPTGSSGPCGPTTEIYCANDAGGKAEVWNIVFNEFFCHGSREALLKGEAKLEPLKTKGIDTGMGFERLVMIIQNKKNIFETDLFLPLIQILPLEISERHKRILADHLRGSVFLLADGLRPSNKEAGYVLRRLLRRLFVYEKIYNIGSEIFGSVIREVIKEYGGFYSELIKEAENIFREFTAERQKFIKTLDRGLKEMKKLDLIDAKIGFKLYETFGLPFEIIKELGGNRAEALTRGGFDEEFKNHQEVSRAGLEKKFGGHGLLLDTGELKAANEEELKKVTRLHTATHLLQAALRKVLGSEIRQDGSDITIERTRFDFTFERKLTSGEIKKIEELVNEAIKKDMPVSREEMDYDQAINSGALHFFKEKYPARVSVWTVSDSKTGEVFSKELCGGPHVSKTGEIGHFKIIKEESSAAGVRRIRGVVD